MNYTDEDEVTEKYVEGCEAQDSEALRRSFLSSEARERAHATGSICISIARPDGSASSYEGLTAETVAQVEAILSKGMKSDVGV